MSDVTGRLAQGESAVGNLASYSAACAALGATDPGLAGRLHEAYAREAGLDLRALDADHAAVTAAGETVQNALHLQDGLPAAVYAAWNGAGAEASAQTLGRHGEASAQAAGALDVAARELGMLRDALWRIVDAKVEATQNLDARTDGVRGDWLTAAETVTTGAGDRASASELVDQQVSPFVACDVATELVAALEDASDAIARSFDSAVARVRDEPVDTFPAGGAWASGPGAGPGPGLGAAAGMAPAPAPAPVMDSVAPAALPTAPTAPMTPPGPSGLPQMGSGLSGSSGLSGLGQQFGELLSGLIPSGEDIGGSTAFDEPEFDSELNEDDEEKEGGEDSDQKEEKDQESPEEPVAEPDSAGTDVPADPAPEVPAPEPLPAEAPAPTPAPAAPLADVAPPAEVPEPPKTPCEIAADELPQAGPTAAAP